MINFGKYLVLNMVRFSHPKVLFTTIVSMVNPPTTIQEVAFCLDDDTMQRLIIGVADHLRDVTFSQCTSQQLPVTTSTVATTTSSENSSSKFLYLLHSAYLSNRQGSHQSSSQWIHYCCQKHYYTCSQGVSFLSQFMLPSIFPQRVKLHEGREIWELRLDLQEFMATRMVWKLQAVHVAHNWCQCSSRSTKSWRHQSCEG